MKKIFFATTVIFTTMMSFANPPKVSEQALASFNQQFSSIADASWTEIGNNYEVRFVQNGIDTRVKYDRAGSILETTRYYGEGELPLLVKSKLKDQYPEKNVFGVIEITKERALTYRIVLEDDNTWTTVDSDYFGNTSVYKKIKKQN